MQKIKAILFDLGGVILNLDTQKTIDSFIALGADLNVFQTKSAIFEMYECGKITTSDFILSLKKELPEYISEALIIEAWNAMLLDLPAQSLEILKELKSKYKLFLFSNTNELHISGFDKIFEKSYPLDSWKNYFDAIYYSHNIGLRKPNASVFNFILMEQNLTARETIFIDDTEMHCNAASELGLKTIHTKQVLGTWFFEELKKIEEEK